MFLATQSTGIPFGPALSLFFSFRVRPVESEGTWRVTTERYDYTLTRPASPDKIVFGWHWHPESRRSRVSYPHLHVPSAESFSTKHVPTGRVSLEDVVMFGFDELNVTPAHATARAVVEEVRSTHKQYRSWN